jgi:hypothetical protein
VAAALGAEVVLTDQAERLPLLTHNVALNAVMASACLNPSHTCLNPSPLSLIPSSLR